MDLLISFSVFFFKEKEVEYQPSSTACSRFFKEINYHMFTRTPKGAMLFGVFLLHKTAPKKHGTFVCLASIDVFFETEKPSAKILQRNPPCGSP